MHKVKAYTSLSAFFIIIVSGCCYKAVNSQAVVHPVYNETQIVSDESELSQKRYPAFQYDNGDDYLSDGLRRIVNESGKIGYADENGTTVIAPRFAFGFPFDNGKAKVTDTGHLVEVPGSNGEYHQWLSDDWYYIDKKGSRISGSGCR